MKYVNYKENECLVKAGNPFNIKILVVIEGNLVYVPMIFVMIDNFLNYQEPSNKMFLTKGAAWCDDAVLNTKKEKIRLI